MKVNLCDFMPQVEALLSEGKSVTIPTSGNSMLPFIVGGVDNVALYKEQTYNVGDIVLAKVDGIGYVLHRVISKNSDNSFTLMGDGNLSGVEHCSSSDIIAKVHSILKPNGNYTNCDNAKYIMFSKIWALCTPVRRPLLAAWKLVNK